MDLFSLGQTLTYKNSNLNNTRKCVEFKKCIDCDRFNNKNRHPRHDLLQACGGYSVCPVWIRLTVNLKSHPRESFRINARWSNKYDTHKSTINKISLELRTWSWFHTNHIQTAKNNNFSINNQRNKNNFYWFNYSSRYQEKNVKN